jgi:hypothetical protein
MGVMSDELSRINRDEWADKPFTLCLVGGTADGRTFRWHERPELFFVPMPEPPLSHYLFPEIGIEGADAFAPRPSANLRYRRTGSVTDDGTHVYEYAGF